MKSFIKHSLIFLLTVTLSVPFPSFAFIHTGKISHLHLLTTSSTVTNKDGKSNVYGGVLDPNVNQVLLLLPKSLLNTIKKINSKRISVTLTSSIDSTRTYSVPKDAIKIQDKIVNKKIAKYLVINIFNLKTKSGINILPSTLPEDNYKLRVKADNIELNSSNSINYQPPAVIAGKLNEQALVSIEDLDGNVISDKTVSTNPNGTFLTEVRANKLPKSGPKLRGILNSGNTDVRIGVIHAVTKTDLYAIIPLGNKPEINTSIIKKPISINDVSTLITNLAKEDNEGLAIEAAQEQLEKLTDSSHPDTDNGMTDIDCNINQFASQCDNPSEDLLSSIGEEFKKIINSNECKFNGVDIIKNIFTSSQGFTNIGKGYCDFITMVQDTNRICLEFQEKLNDYYEGKITNLPCPPAECNITNEIIAATCSNPLVFCEDSVQAPPQCLNKPVSDLFCNHIGTDIKDEECSGKIDPSSNDSQYPEWIIIQNSFGNEYCVPSSTEGLSSLNDLSFPVEDTNKTPEELAEDCELFSCHKNCDKDFGLATDSSLNCSTPACDCHIKCDLASGVVNFCSEPSSKYFSADCCTASNIESNIVTRCVCRSTSNFEDNGFVKDSPREECTHIYGSSTRPTPTPYPISTVTVYPTPYSSTSSVTTSTYTGPSSSTSTTYSTPFPISGTSATSSYAGPSTGSSSSTATVYPTPFSSTSSVTTSTYTGPSSSSSSTTSSTSLTQKIFAYRILVSNDTVTLYYMKDPSVSCLTLHFTDNAALNLSGHCLYEASGTSISLSNLQYHLSQGTQIKLCDNFNTNNCSNIVTVSGQ